MVERASGQPEPDQVSAAAVNAAFELIDTYFKPIALRVFGEAAIPADVAATTKLATCICKQRLDRLGVANSREPPRNFKLRLTGPEGGPAGAATRQQTPAAQPRSRLHAHARSPSRKPSASVAAYRHANQRPSRTE